MVWLIDKAIREYGLARESIIAQLKQDNLCYEEQLGSGQPIFMFDFTDHMENCLLTGRRIFRIVEGLKSDTTIAPMDQLTRKLVESVEKELTPIRNELEHVAEKIASGEIPDGQSLTVVLADDEKSIQVGSKSLRFDRFACALKGLHSIAEGLFNKPS